MKPASPATNTELSFKDNGGLADNNDKIHVNIGVHFVVSSLQV